MSSIKFIDSDKLDAVPEATASVIREKTGDSGSIAFDFNGETGFTNAVEEISAQTEEIVNILLGNF